MKEDGVIVYQDTVYASQGSVTVFSIWHGIFNENI